MSTAVERKVAALVATANNHTADTDYARGIVWGMKFAAGEMADALKEDAYIKPLEVGEAVKVELLSGSHNATILTLGPVLCYVEMTDEPYTGQKAAVTLSELAEWNR